MFLRPRRTGRRDVFSLRTFLVSFPIFKPSIQEALLYANDGLLVRDPSSIIQNLTTYTWEDARSYPKDLNRLKVEGTVKPRHITCRIAEMFPSSVAVKEAGTRLL